MNNRRLAKNTLFLYIRMFVSMGISFFTAGIVLKTLGVVDYGINNVVGGLVSMFTLISSSLSAASSRFITFELGKKGGEPQKVFSTSVHIHILLAVIVAILLETVGSWFLSNKLVIPAERMTAAFWVFQFSIMTTVVNLINIPYVADMVANEHMSAFAYIGILDSLLRLAILFILVLGDFDKLILYGMLQFMVVLSIQAIYYIYCKRHFKEARVSWHTNPGLLRKMVTFSGWNFIGSSSALLRDQGVNMILNMFCGPAINAARGIGMSVNGIINGFGTNLLAAINPQITKNYANGNLYDTFILVTKASRYAFLLLFLIVIPILSRTGLLLKIWLGEVPDHAVLFTQLTLCFSLIEILSNPLITLMLAMGNIKWYQIIVGGVQLLNLPLSYYCLSVGLAPESTVCSAIAVSFVCLYLRLIMLHRMTGLNLWIFHKEVLAKALFITCLSLSFYFLVNPYFGQSTLASFAYLALSFVANGLLILTFGMKKNERAALCLVVLNKIRRVKS